MAKDFALATRWLAAQGVDFSEADLAEAGGAPLALSAAQDFNLRGWLLALERAADPVDGVAALLKSDVVDVLARWVRLLLAQQKHAADKQTLAFINEINQVRIALQSSNSVNVQLLLEKLLAQWFALSSYKQKTS
jgi:hypothetical protein